MLKIKFVFMLLIPVMLIALILPARATSNSYDPADWEIIEVDIAVREMVYDPIADRIYATSPYFDVVYAINPNSGNVSTLIDNLDYPRNLALSDDSSTLYVSFNDGSGHSILQFDLLAQTQIRTFDLGNSSNYPLQALDMEVIPGEANKVVIARDETHSNSSTYDVAIFEDGQLLPNTVSAYALRYIEPATSSILYGHDTAFNDFYTMQMDDMGVVTTSSPSGVIGGPYDIEYDSGDGLVYSSQGRVVNPVARTLVHSYTVQYLFLVEPVSEIDRTFFMRDNPLRLYIYDQSDFTSIEAFPVPNIPIDPGFGQIYSLIHTSGYGIAFNYVVEHFGGAAAYKFYLVRSLYGMEAHPQPEYQLEYPGQTVTYSIDITNIGSVADVYDVNVVSNDWPITISDNMVSLNPGQSTSIDVNITIPSTVTGAVLSESKINIASQNTNVVARDISLWTEAIFHDVVAQPQVTYLANSPGQTVTYTIDITNTGNITDTYDIDVASNDWPVQVSISNTGFLTPNQNITISIEVSIPEAISGEKVAETEILITSQLMNSVSRQVNLTTEAIFYEVYLPFMRK